MCVVCPPSLVPLATRHRQKMCKWLRKGGTAVVAHQPEAVGILPATPLIETFHTILEVLPRTSSILTSDHQLGDMRPAAIVVLVVLVVLRLMLPPR